jgi:hypothetical protein
VKKKDETRKYSGKIFEERWVAKQGDGWLRREMGRVAR